MISYDVPDLPVSPAEDIDYDRAVQNMLDECPLCDHVICDVTLRGDVTRTGMSARGVLDLTDDVVMRRALAAVGDCEYLLRIDGSHQRFSTDADDGTWTATIRCDVATPGYMMHEDEAESFIIEPDEGGWWFDRTAAEEDFERDVEDDGFAESSYMDKVAEALTHAFADPWGVSEDVGCEVVAVTLA